MLGRSKEGGEDSRMSFCRLVAQNHGIFVLVMASDDGHQYLTDEAITELVNTLQTLKEDTKLRGLVTTAKIGSFCDGIDHDNILLEQAVQLAQRMTEVIRLLLEMPVPTAAAVGGDATSLGLALALAHDHCVVWEDAALGLPEARRGRPLPDYAPALLRDKVAYARLRKLLVLKSQGCTGKELVSTWWSAHAATDDRHMVVDGALEVLEGVEVGEETDFAKARQTMWPESCAAVGIEIPQTRPRPSPDELQRETATDYPAELYDMENKQTRQRLPKMHKTSGVHRRS